MSPITSGARAVLACVALVALSAPPTRAAQDARRDAPAPAQAKIKFDPTRDLDGFEDCRRSEFSDIYPVAHYDDLLGKEMSPAELEKLQKSWKAEVAEAMKAIAGLRADPLGVFVHRLHRKLATDPYFSKIAFTEDRSTPPYVFIVQNPAKEEAGYAKRVIASNLPWIQKLRQVIDATYVQPLALQPRDEHAGVAVCILASRGDYANYARTSSSKTPGGVPSVDIAAGFEDPFEATSPAPRKRYSLLWQLARITLDAYLPEGVSLSWLTASGLPGYLAYHEGFTPDVLAQRKLDDDALGVIVDALQKKERAAVFLQPVEDLLTIRDSESLAALARRCAAAARVHEPPWNDLIDAIYAQASTWMHFLQDANDAKYRARFLKYLEAEFRGQRGVSSFQAAFEGVDLAALNHEFYAFVLAERQRAHPTPRLDPLLIEGLFAGRAAAMSATNPTDDAAEAPHANGAPPPARAAGVAPAAPAFRPITLALDPADVEVQHALALQHARRGDLDGARAALVALAGKNPAAPEDARIARDVDRLAQLALLREGYFESFQQSGSKWSSEYQGKKFVAKIEKVDGGFVQLGENKAGITKIPLADLDLVEIARTADKKEKLGKAPQWSRAYALVLAGDAKWDKLAKDPSDAARELYQDAKAWYPELVRTGQAAALVDKLSKTSLPKTRAEGDAVLASMKELMSSGASLPFVQQRMDGLRTFATTAAELGYTQGDLGKVVHGAFTALGDGRVKIVYDFTNANQALDFRKHAGYLDDWYESVQPTKKSEPQSTMTVSNGAWRGTGHMCYRWRLGLAAPYVVRCTYKITNEGVDDAVDSGFSLATCDDGKESCINCGNTGGITVEDVKTRYVKRSFDPKGDAVNLGDDVRFEIHHDGAKVSTWIDDKTRHEASCGARTSGGVFFWIHTDYSLEIQRLELEGALDPESLKSLKSDWIAKTLAELGFK
jgi:hypothetical protein